MALYGRYYSNNFTTTKDEDLITAFRTGCGVATAVIKKLTLITDFDLGLDINGLGKDSHLYKNSDDMYVLSLDSNDLAISSIVPDTSSETVFIAGVF